MENNQFWVNRSIEKKRKAKKEHSKGHKLDHSKEGSGRKKNDQTGKKLPSARKKKSKTSRAISVVNSNASDRKRSHSKSRDNVTSGSRDRFRPSDEKCIQIRIDIGPKDYVHQAREVDNDDVNKLVHKFRTQREAIAVTPTSTKEVDFKTALVLDRVNKKSFGSRYKKLSAYGGGGSSTKTGAMPMPVPLNIQLGFATGSPATAKEKDKTLPMENTAQTNTMQTALPIETIIEPPKIEDLLKGPPDKVYTDAGIPYWMVNLEPTEEDMNGIEATCPIGSEHLEMFYEKKFVLVKPSTEKIVLDTWQNLVDLIARDETFFTPEVVFSNTMRSLINVATKINKNPSLPTDKKDSHAKRKETNSDEEDHVTFILPKKEQIVYYSRQDPIRSVLNQKEMTSPSDNKSGKSDKDAANSPKKDTPK